MQPSPFARLKVLELSASTLDLGFLGQLQCLETIVAKECLFKPCACEDTASSIERGCDAWPLLASGSRALKVVRVEDCEFLYGLMLHASGQKVTADIFPLPALPSPSMPWKIKTF